MSYKITVKIGETNPLLVHNNQLSEVEVKKKKSLYQQPERDQPPKKGKTVEQLEKKQKGRPEIKGSAAVSGEGENYRKAQKLMMEDLNKISKNQASLDMIRHSNSIQQKQNQILEQNQKTIHHLVQNAQPNQYEKNNGQQLKEVLKQVIKQVDEIRKIRDEIMLAGKQMTKVIGESSKGGKQVHFEAAHNITEMNSNLKNLAEVSKNQLEGLQNLQAIKNLQNFNIQNYTQSINALKKQIVQYQRESENIERQLKLRAAKLQKLQVNPNIDQKIMAPYENYLKKKADAIDMHALRQKVYQKLGLLDYAKFQNDANQIMAEVKGQMNDFAIVCKQYRVQAPDIKIDQRQLRNLDIKLNSALDEYKAERGINFAETNANKGLGNTGELNESNGRIRRNGQAIVNRKGGKHIPKAIRQLNTKPLDLATQVKLQKPENEKKSILQNRKEHDKRSVEKNIKKGKLIQQQDFDKFLQDRANEELQQLYKEKRQRLQKQKKQLYQEIKEEPSFYLNLDLKNQLQKDKFIKKPITNQEEEKQGKGKQEKETVDQFKEIKPITEGQAIKSIGTEVLREKLKNILGKSHNQNTNRLEGPHQLRDVHPESEVPKMENMAENFLNLINNTLTQVNNQISQTIQNKYEQRSLSKQKTQYHKRSPIKIAIPKLEQFRPPPSFNMQYMQPTEFHAGVLPMEKRPQIKILPKNYEHLEIKDDQDYGDLEISGQSYQQDFQ